MKKPTLQPSNPENTVATMAALYPQAFAAAAASDSPSGRALRIWAAAADLNRSYIHVEPGGHAAPTTML